MALSPSSVGEAPPPGLDEAPDGGIPQPDDSSIFIHAVLYECTIFPRKGDCIFCEPEDGEGKHLHVIYRGGQNAQRRLRSLISQCGVPAGEAESRSQHSQQVVVNLKRMLRYMASRGRLVLQGDFFLQYIS